jgi:SAM-dependent methyltransferase
MVEMAETPHTHVWGNATAYDAYIGRWSRPVAWDFLAWLDPAPGGRWVDVGCGTGALTAAILTRADPREIVGIDPSPDFISAASTQVADPRVRFVIGDAGDLPVPDGACDAAVSGLVLNHLPEPEQALAEMVRITRPQGVVAAYVWDYAAQMELVRTFWQAAIALDPTATKHDQGVQFPLCQPEPLTALFAAVGLQEVAVQAIDVPTNFRDFDDYWLPHVLGGSGIAQRYVTALEGEQREALRALLQTSLPIADDGTIALLARAWAVRGMTA